MYTEIKWENQNDRSTTIVSKKRHKYVLNMPYISVSVSLDALCARPIQCNIVNRPYKWSAINK